ncbi:unnamed protein product [Fusarium graminearum]|nr:unnamed protein product [Fusarium graminearum]CAG1975090.1 unnamed protein product [Fusarium graminearum]
MLMLTRLPPPPPPPLSSRLMPLLHLRNPVIRPLLLTNTQVRLLLRATQCSPRTPFMVVVNQPKDIPRPHSMKKPPGLALPQHQQILKQIPVAPPAADVVTERATGTAPTVTTAPTAGKRCVSGVPRPDLCALPLCLSLSRRPTFSRV